MAQKVITELVDDLDGTPAADTVEFALDGKTYELELSATNIARLRNTLGEYIPHARRRYSVRPARRATSRSSSSATPRSREQAAEIRRWANANGYGVSDHGRIPINVIDAWANRKPNSNSVIPAQQSTPERTPEPKAKAAPTPVVAAPVFKTTAAEPEPVTKTGAKAKTNGAKPKEADRPKYSTMKQYNDAVRKWGLKTAGVKCSPRGRIPAETYAAHKEEYGDPIIVEG